MIGFKFSKVTFAILMAASSLVYGAEKAEFIGNINGHRGAVQSLQFSQEGRTLLSGSEDGTAKTWDISSGKLMQSIGQRKAGLDRALFSPDNRFVLTTGKGDTVYLWDVASGKQFGTLRGAPGPQNCLAMSPNGEFVAVGCENAMLAIWRVADQAPLHVVQAHDGPIARLMFSPDNQYVATVGKDGAIRVWEITTGYLAFSMKADTELNCIAFHPIGQDLAVAGDYITVFNLKSGKILKTLRGHTGPIRCLAFTPNGQFLASGSEDKTTKLWSVITGRLVDTLQSQDGAIITLAFAPDGRTLASGSQKFVPAQGKPVGDDTIALWNMSQLYSDGRISLYVERELYHWVKKGEFEKQAAYEARLNTIQVEAGKFFTDAYRKFENDVREGASLSLYDVEREEFTVNLPSLGKFQVHVPLAKAREFKEQFPDMVFRNFVVEPDLKVPAGSTWTLKRVEIFSPALKQSFFYGDAA